MTRLANLRNRLGSLRRKRLDRASADRLQVPENAARNQSMPKAGNSGSRLTEA
jgi:hypothetical protein